MTSNRDRFKEIALSQRTGELSMVAPYGNWFWPETLVKWIEDGAPQQLMNSSWCSRYFGYDYMPFLNEIISGPQVVPYEVGVNAGLLFPPPIVPLFDTKVLEEDGHTITLINQAGQTSKVFKADTQKMPMFLDHPVKDWDTWKEYKKRLDPASPGRYPDNWQEFAARKNAKDAPLGIWMGSLFGFLRDWMGVENLLYTFYDDPALIEEMMDTVLELELDVFKKTAADIKLDWAIFYEDMAYKAGPMISPDMFRKFMAPRYRVITDLLHKHGIDIIIVESDGNLNELIPLWLECGINGFSPLEVAAHNDVVALKKEYGNDVILFGNIDKRPVIEGKDAIKKEVMYKLPYMLEKGGYFPAVDHGVPPEVTLENYQYMINTIREVAGLEKLPFSD